MASLRVALRRTPPSQVLRRTLTIARSSPLARRTYATVQQRPAEDHGKPQLVQEAQEDLSQDGEDPNMNGNYPDPSLTSALPVKRQHRDPYADWWDPIERRNYGEPVHEDNDILGVFSTEDYTHFSTAWGGVLMGCFVGAVGVLCAVVARYYPDMPAAPRTFPGGLEAELGGPKAVRARMTEDEESIL